MLSACYWFLLLLSTSFMFSLFVLFFFFNYPATSEIYTLSLHDALPILRVHREIRGVARSDVGRLRLLQVRRDPHVAERHLDRKSTRLNSSHTVISYAVFCLKKKKKQHTITSLD